VFKSEGEAVREVKEWEGGRAREATWVFKSEGKAVREVKEWEGGRARERERERRERWGGTE